MDLEGDPLIQIGIAGTLAQELARDHEAFVHHFALAVQAAFPNDTTLKYEGGFLSKKRLAGVSIRLGDDTYSLMKPAKGPVESTRTHVVCGIALKTEPIPIDEWLGEVSAKLEARVSSDSHARSALAAALGLH